MQQENTIHSQTARHEPRGPHGEFLSSHSAPNDAPNGASPNTPSFLTQLWHKLSKLTIKKIMTIATFIYLVFTNSIFLNIVENFFPHSSPILHRVIAHQGILQISGSGMYSLKLSDSSVYALELKPTPALSNLKNLREVVVKGNLTFKPYLIENAEIYPVNISTP